MGMLHADGFDHYGPNQNGMGSIYSVASRIQTNNDGSARTGNYYTRFVDNFAQMSWTFPASEPKAVLGCGLRVGGYSNSGAYGANDPYLGFQLADNKWISIAVGGTGQIVLSLGSTVIAQSNPKIILVGVWYWVEFLVDNSGPGKVVVRVNEVPVLEYDGAIDLVDIVATMHYNTFSSTFDIDDYVVTDGDFPGDRRCITVFPNGAGASQDWTVNGGDNAWDCLNNVPADPTKYLAATEAGEKSTFSLSALQPNISSVLGFAVYSSQQKTDAGAANTKVGIISGVGENDAAERTLPVGFSMFEDIFYTNPVTEAPYSPADAYAAQVAITRTV